jgi:hypothetical protein
MVASGGKAVGAGSLVPLAGYESASNDRLYLALRTNSRKLEIVGSKITVSVSDEPNCVAFHHTRMNSSGNGHTANGNGQPSPPPPPGSVTALAMMEESKNPVVRFWIAK